MKYMLLIYEDESQLTESIQQECYQESVPIALELASKGQLMGTAPLHSASTASTVRIQGGQRIVTTGPFAETHEQLGGFFLVDVPSLEDALAIASRLPSANRGSIEVRPVVELPGLDSVG